MNQQAIEAREFALKAILHAFGKKLIPWQVFKNVLSEIQIGQQNVVSEDQIAKDLREIVMERGWPTTGCEIKSTGEGIEFRPKDMTTVDQRSTDHAGTKAALAAAAWQFLFGNDKMPRIKGSYGKSEIHYAGNFLAKRQELRRKHTPSLWIDAGSTTAAFAARILKEPDLPFEVTEEGEPGDMHPTSRLVRPVIHTNSYQIVDAIAQSTRHRRYVRVRVIGGELNMGLKSVSGVLSSSCLDAWGLRGDLAVVGATGVSDYLGQPTLFCDNLEESHLKGRFLDACWVKVAFFDSSKIGKGTVNQAFCAVSSASLDLIVTDDGIHSKNPEKVRQLKDKALAAGVSFLIAKSVK